MLGMLILVGFFGSGLIISAIEWLGHLSGRNGPRSQAVRYLLPILAPVCFALLLRDEIRSPLPTTTTNVGILVAVSIVFVALVLWLLTEMARYRARPQGIYRSGRYRSRARKPR